MLSQMVHECNVLPSTIHMIDNSPCCKLYTNRAFAFKVELVARESRQKVTLSDTRVADENN